MQIGEIISVLESMASPHLQEKYDNAGLLTGNPEWECRGILCTLDATEEVIREAIDKKCNLVVTHHPIIFGGLKRITGRNYVERAVITSIRNDIAIYAIHTNLDNIIQGVNGRIAEMIGLKNCTILSPKENTLSKLFTFVPPDHAEKVRDAIFQAGGGQISKYSECSFSVEGMGTFKAGPGTDPFVGEVGRRHSEHELKVEVIIPSHLQGKIIEAMKKAHPYEEVAYDLVSLANSHPQVGAGLLGELEHSLPETQFLDRLKDIFHLKMIRHTRLLGKPVKKVALCGGAGSFLIFNALALKADLFLTADIKYHEFFDANDRIVLADIGHFESEQFTINLLQEILVQKFPTFAVLKTEVITNPVHYH